LDPARSAVEFHVPHIYGLVTVTGRFDGYAGTLDMSATPAVNLTIDADSLGSDHPKRDAHLRSADFFDVEHHPMVGFASETVRIDGRLMFVTGRLNAGGRSIALRSAATLHIVEDELEIEAVARVNQRDLGMTYSPLGMIRTPSKLTVAGRLVRDLDSATASPGQERPPTITGVPRRRTSQP
jgi:polyisoprenoid-binding protein YceI